MRQVALAQSRNQTNSNIYMDSSLETPTQVFVRTDAVRTPLRPTYRVPYSVMEKIANWFKIDIDDKVDSLTVDWLNAAHIDKQFLTIQQPRVARAPHNNKNLNTHKVIPLIITPPRKSTNLFHKTKKHTAAIEMRSH